MIDTIIDGATKFLTGGTLGVVGALGSGVINLFKAKQKGQKEVEILKAKLAIAERLGSDGARIIQSVDASYIHDKASYQDASGIDIYRGAVRPTIVYFLTFTSVGIACWAIWKVGIDYSVIKLIANTSVDKCWALTGIAVGWYFGGRDLRK